MSTTVEDQELVRARRGDREAFGKLIEAHQSAVYGYLRARLSDVTIAEDLTQEVFLRFYVGRMRFDEETNVRPWLIGIARNLLREHVRHLRRRREVAWTELCLELDELTKCQQDLEDERLDHLPECLRSLGPKVREAIDLRYRSKMRLAEIGSRLKRSEGAVKVMMFRARKALKSCLRGDAEQVTDD